MTNLTRPTKSFFKNKISMLLPIMLAMFFTQSHADDVPPPAQPIKAGAFIKSKIHWTPAIVITTVETTYGTYHIHGAMSAQLKDKLTIVHQAKDGSPSLCIVSNIRNTCYPIL